MNGIRKFILTGSKIKERSNSAFNAITDQFIRIGKRQPHFYQKQKNDNPISKKSISTKWKFMSLKWE